jgi:hypothetical protein
MKLERTKKHLQAALDSVPMGFNKIKTSIRETLDQIKSIETKKQAQKINSVVEQWKFDLKKGCIVNPAVAKESLKFINEEIKKIQNGIDSSESNS